MQHAVCTTTFTFQFSCVFHHWKRNAHMPVQLHSYKKLPKSGMSKYRYQIHDVTIPDQSNKLYI